MRLGDLCWWLLLGLAVAVVARGDQYCEWRTCDVKNERVVCESRAGVLSPQDMAREFWDGKTIKYSCWPVSEAQRLGKIPTPAETRP